MIVKNEEPVIGRCLESVKDLVDEIIIVDTGSTDRTREIVSKYTDKVYDYEWKNDFAAARNYDFSKATKDYIMWLDADDVVFPKEKKKFLKAKKNIAVGTDVVMMIYEVEFDETGKVTQSFYRERLFRRERKFEWKGRIHESIDIYDESEGKNKITHAEVKISHQPILENKDKARNLRILEDMLAKGEEFTARDQNYYAIELAFNKRYEEAIVELNRYIEREDSWLEPQINCCLELSRCYQGLGDDKQALYSLFRSFDYDEPRAEICCEVGKLFYAKKNYKVSIEWYKYAFEKDVNNYLACYRSNDCYDIVPAIHLCACYEALGDRKKALYYHELTKQFNPNHDAVIRNEAYFKNAINREKLLKQNSGNDYNKFIPVGNNKLPKNLSGYQVVQVDMIDPNILKPGDKVMIKDINGDRIVDSSEYKRMMANGDLDLGVNFEKRINDLENGNYNQQNQYNQQGQYNNYNQQQYQYNQQNQYSQQYQYSQQNQYKQQSQYNQQNQYVQQQPKKMVIKQVGNQYVLVDENELISNLNYGPNHLENNDLNYQLQNNAPNYQLQNDLTNIQSQSNVANNQQNNYSSYQVGNGFNNEQNNYSSYQAGNSFENLQVENNTTNVQANDNLSSSIKNKSVSVVDYSNFKNTKKKKHNKKKKKKK
jgi:glycosyltransferase involved in cell wall biosynthesis